MIADKNLQLANNAPFSRSGGTDGYQILPNYLDLAKAGNIGRGTQLYAQVTIRQSFVGTGVEVVEWRVHASSVPVLPSGALDNPAYEILFPTLGTSGQIFVANLTAGKKITFAINPLAHSARTGSPIVPGSGDSAHTAQGLRYIYATMLTFDSTTGALQELNEGYFDFDIVLEAAPGLQGVQYDDPYYPTAITQV